MSRVHDALRRAEHNAPKTPNVPLDNPAVKRAETLRTSGHEPEPGRRAAIMDAPAAVLEPPPEDAILGSERSTFTTLAPEAQQDGVALEALSVELLSRVQEIQFQPAPESYLIDWSMPQAVPSEEFRSLRTRLNHLQASQRLSTLVISSPSPAEGKTFTSVNLALAQSHLAEKRVLLADFDLRRPRIHSLLQIDREPGLSDYLLGHAPLSAVLRKIADTNLYVMPAGSHVKNPLELLNRKQVRALVDELPDVFHWTIIDTPPLLFSADANLLATLADGTLLVVKIGETTFDNVIRAMQSLCENNVLGIVANGARASELYSKYTYYYSKPD
jgi:receptor protein-tyrosine kinase